MAWIVDPTSNARPGRDATELRPTIETYVHPATSTTLATDVELPEGLGGPIGIAQRLRDPQAFARVERALAGSLAGDLGSGVSTFAHAREAAWIGRDIHSLARDLGVTPARLAAQVLRDDPGALFVFQRPQTDAWVENTKATIANEATIVASDGIYRPGLMHPRDYGTFPRFLRLATRDWATLDLPTAIHTMTGRTAGRYGRPDLGDLRVGGAADAVVFDPETVAERSRFEEPRRPLIGFGMCSRAGRRSSRDSRSISTWPLRIAEVPFRGIAALCGLLALT